MKKNKSSSFRSELLAEYKERKSLIGKICKEIDVVSEKIKKNKVDPGKISEVEIDLIGNKVAKLRYFDKKSYFAIFYLDYAHHKLVLAKTDKFVLSSKTEDHVFIEFDMDIIVESLNDHLLSVGELRSLYTSLRYML